MTQGVQVAPNAGKECCYFCSSPIPKSQKAVASVGGKQVPSHIDCAYRGNVNFRTPDGYVRDHITLVTYQRGRSHYSAQMAITHMRRSKGKYVFGSTN